MKAFAILVVSAGAISYLSKLKAEQLAARWVYPVKLAWRHGTSDIRLQQAIDRNDGKAVSALLTKVDPSAIRENIIDRLAFNKTSSALESFLDARPPLHWDPNGIRHDGRPLLIAASTGQARALAILLNHGGNPNAKDDRGHSVLYWACTTRYSGPEIIKRLAKGDVPLDSFQTFVVLSRRPNQVQGSGQPATETRIIKLRVLAIAAQRGNIPAIQTLLRLGSRAQAVQGEDLPPIVAAAYADSIKATQILIDAGADVDAEGEAYLFDIPAPIGATRRRRGTVVRATALYVNAFLDNPEAVKLLLAHGADPLYKASSGKTPVDVAGGDSLPILQQAISARNGVATAIQKTVVGL